MNVLFLTTLSTLKACNSPYMQYYFNSKVIFSFLINESRQKAIEIETAFFIPLGILRVTHWIISFMLHISVITDTYIGELVDIFLKLSMKTVQVHLIIRTTLDNRLEWISLDEEEFQNSKEVQKI